MSGYERGRVVIAGPRDLTPTQEDVKLAVLDAPFEVLEIVSGNASGVDRAAEQFALDHNFGLKRFPAKWETHGKAAGPIRNRQMAGYADALIVIKRPGPTSRGTYSMMAEAKQAGIPTHVREVSG